MAGRYEISAVTHRGFHRARNEDRIAVNEWSTSATSENPRIVEITERFPVICMVVDGMGGHAGGQLASRIAVRDAYERLKNAEKKPQIEIALEEVNQEIFSSMDVGTYGMGATIAGVRISDNAAFAFNVGDSRVYLFSNDQISQVSVDDTIKDKKSGKKIGNAITQSLGGQFNRQRISPHIFEIQKSFWECIIICSDGLCDFVEDQEIESILRFHPTDSVSRLLKLALSRGGRDNISIISIRVS